MKIIGINSEYDGAKKKITCGSCALIIDGKIEIALAEERISRKKHAGGFKSSYTHIMKSYNLSPKDIDYYYISFYAQPLIPDKELINIHLKELGIEDMPQKLVVVPSHHLSHAYAAYFLSPFDEAIIMVADNEGSLLYPKYKMGEEIYNNYYERNSYYWAKGNNITLIERDFEKPGSVGFGKAYNKFNRYIGLGNYLSVGKTMGLSSYGTITKELENINLWDIDENGKLISKMKDTNNAYKDVPAFFKEYGINLPEDRNDESEIMYETSLFKNLAYFVQNQLNKWSVKKITNLVERIGIKNVCISGGVALNGIMNREIEEKVNVSTFVPPYPSDPGQALGNAIYGYIEKTGLNNSLMTEKVTFSDFTYLGSIYSDEDIDEEIKNYRGNVEIEVTYPENIFKFTAEQLKEGKILGWYQGRSEYGARALGNRSIIAAPNSKSIRDRVNMLKGRENFRPVAPSVIKEYAQDFFESYDSYLDPYMLKVTYVKDDKKSLIEGVVHVDGTARIQTVTEKQNYKYYRLINEYYNITGLPLIINTSFNAAGEPIVESATDAINSFITMELDGLVCNNAFIKIK